MDTINRLNDTLRQLEHLKTITGYLAGGSVYSLPIERAKKYDCYELKHSFETIAGFLSMADEFTTNIYIELSLLADDLEEEAMKEEERRAAG